MKAVVWSKYDCSYCDQAKALLTQQGYQIEEKKNRRRLHQRRTTRSSAIGEISPSDLYQ